MKLVKRLTPSSRRPKGDVLLGRENGSGVRYSPDGELVETLAGEPPLAQSHGWGNLSFLYQRRW